MAGTLQIEMRQGDDSLALNTSPYTLDAYSSGGRTLELDVRVTGATMAETERYASAVERWIKRAGAHAGQLLGDAVYVYSKVCDDLSVMAELGAGWARKRITGGGVIRQKSQPPHTTITLRLSLEVDESWRRAGVESILAGTSNVSARSDGGITSDGAAVTARRINWSRTTGFTGRLHWEKASADAVFFWFNQFCYAEWDNGDAKFRMCDINGNAAESVAQTIADGATVDLVFVWDPDTPRMEIYSDGVSIASVDSCEFYPGSVSAEKLLNTSFENLISGTPDDGANDVPTYWTAGNTAGNSLESISSPHSGTYAFRLTKNGGTLPYIKMNIIPTTGMIVFRLWTKDDGGSLGYSLQDATHSAWITAQYETPGPSSIYIMGQQAIAVPSGCVSIAVFLVGIADGVAAYVDDVSLVEIADTDVDEYTVFEPTGEQSILNVQVWPAALTDAEAAALYQWGRPEAELAFYEAPADSKSTNAVYPVRNVPGNEMAALRLVLAGDSQDFDQVLAALRPGRIQTAVGFECEDGTLGSNTSSTSDTDASGGDVARLTPPDAAWHTEVTIAVASDPDDVEAFLGDYRLFLAGKDNAASVGLNQISFRLVIGDVAGSWSDTVSLGSVATRSLVELGELHIPPGAWPEETIDATTDEHGGDYVEIEIRVKNTAATGTLDLDAIYLVPSEAEGVADTSDWDVSAQSAVLDFASDPAAMILATDAVSLEFAGWIDYLGDRLLLLPGAENLLWLFGMRDSAEQAFPNDILAAYLFFAPNWRR